MAEERKAVQKFKNIMALVKKRVKERKKKGSRKERRR